MLDFVSLATPSVKLAAAFNSVPLVPTLKPFQSTVFVTTVLIPAIPVALVPPSALPASQDSIL
jgi:hypothetical protein